MSCERIQEMMAEALYNELDADAGREFEEHVSGCTNCAALLQEMRTTLSTMNERSRPDPGEDYWNSYVERLEARMDREQSVVDGRFSPARRRTYVSWGYRVAAAVAVLIAGVWIGRSTMPRNVVPPGPAVVASSSQTDSSVAPENVRQDQPQIAAEQSVRHDAIDDPALHEPPPATGAGNGPGNVVAVSTDARAREYIERSQVLLLALVNAGDGGGDAQLGLQRERAGALVREAAVLRDDLPGSQNRRLRELVTDLQMILREIANLENENDLEAVQIIRNRVNREGVLLQIDVQQMRDEGGKPQSRTGGAID